MVTLDNLGSHAVHMRSKELGILNIRNSKVPRFYVKRWRNIRNMVMVYCVFPSVISVAEVFRVLKGFSPFSDLISEFVVHFAPTNTAIDNTSEKGFLGVAVVADCHVFVHG